MDADLSPKQKLLLNIIKEYRRKHGESPTLSELQTMLGVPFLNSVVHLLGKLEEKGYIQRAKGVDRGITPVGNTQMTINIPVVGAVACGRPLLAQENVEGYIPVDRKLISDDPKKYFFLKAMGDSMDRAGIKDGDMVLIHSQQKARPEERVIALIDDEATIKIFRPGDGFVALVPKSSNPANKPIILRKNFAIQGIVKAVYQKEMLTA
jgi:repressor LexA